MSSIRQYMQSYLEYTAVSGGIQKHRGERYFSQRAEPRHLSLIQASSLHTGRLRNLQVVPHTKWSNNRTCEILLTCSVENPNDNILFRWQVSGNTLQSEANLTISWDPKSFNEETYTCIAENPVSNSSFSVSVQSLCKSKYVSGLSESLEWLWGVGCLLWSLWFLKQQPSRRQPSDTGKGQTSPGAPCLSLPQRSLLPPSPSTNPFSSPLRSQEQSPWEGRIASSHWLYQAPPCPVCLNGTPTPRKPAHTPRASGYRWTHPTPKDGLEEMQ